MALIRMLAMTVLCCGLTSGPDRSRAVQQVDIKKMKATIERLEQPIIIDLIETQFKDAVRLIESLSKLKLDMEDWTPPTDVKVTLHAEEDSLAVVLQQILDEAQGRYAVKTNGEILVTGKPLPKKR